MRRREVRRTPPEPCENSYLNLIKNRWALYPDRLATFRTPRGEGVHVALRREHPGKKYRFKRLIVHHALCRALRISFPYVSGSADDVGEPVRKFLRFLGPVSFGALALLPVP